MSFKSKTDYFGLSSSTLLIVSSDENKSAQVAQAHDEKGDIVAQEVYGETMAPTCSYVVKGNT